MTGRQFTGFAMAGYRFVRDKLFVTVFAGVDTQYHGSRHTIPTNSLRGTSHRHPRCDRTLVRARCADDVGGRRFGDQRRTELFGARRIRLARLFDAFYVGPEVAGFAGGDTYKQCRAGIHVTGFRTGTIEWSLAGRLGDGLQATVTDLTAGSGCMTRTITQSSVRLNRVTAIVIAISISTNSAIAS